MDADIFATGLALPPQPGQLLSLLSPRIALFFFPILMPWFRTISPWGLGTVDTWFGEVLEWALCKPCQFVTCLFPIFGQVWLPSKEALKCKYYLQYPSVLKLFKFSWSFSVSSCGFSLHRCEPHCLDFFFFLKWNVPQTGIKYSKSPCGP